VKRYLYTSCLLFVPMTIFFGVVYPLLIWGFAQLSFPQKAEGSPLTVDGKVVGFRNIGQRFTTSGYLWGRPSAEEKEDAYLVSGGSNLSWSSSTLRIQVERREREVQSSLNDRTEEIPEDLIMASASGCDPDISLKAALMQLPRISKERNVSILLLKELLTRYKEPEYLGLFPRRVNVLLFNLALDARYPIVGRDE